MLNFKEIKYLCIIEKRRGTMRTWSPVAIGAAIISGSRSDETILREAQHRQEHSQQAEKATFKCELHGLKLATTVCENPQREKMKKMRLLGRNGIGEALIYRYL